MRPLSDALVLLLSAAMVAGFGWLGLAAWRDDRAFGDAPRHVALEGAILASTGGRQWVTVERAPWRCRELRGDVPGGAAFLPASAADGATIVARFDHAIRCEDVASAPLTGIVEPMAKDRERDLRAAGMTLPEGAALRTLDVCAFCGKDNARLGVIVCAVFVLAGLLLYPLRHLFPWSRLRPGAALQQAIHAPDRERARAERTIRAWGAAAVVAGVFAVVYGGGWVAYGVVRVPWLGAIGIMCGAFMVAFPERYRTFVKRR